MMRYTTIARNDGSADPADPATTSGIRMKPPWLMLEYASRRTMLVWRNATTLPTVIVSAAITQMNGRYTSTACGNARYTSRIKATKPAALDATLRKAVTG